MSLEEGMVRGTCLPMCYSKAEVLSAHCLGAGEPWNGIQWWLLALTGLSSKLTHVAHKRHIRVSFSLWVLPTHKAVVLFYLLLQMKGKYTNHLRPPIQRRGPGH